MTYETASDKVTQCTYENVFFDLSLPCGEILRVRGSLIAFTNLMPYFPRMSTFLKFATISAGIVPIFLISYIIDMLPVFLKNIMHQIL